jgi:hypothetical protein
MVLHLTDSTHLLPVVEVVPFGQGLLIPPLGLVPLPIDTAHDREGSGAQAASTAVGLTRASLSRGLHSWAVIGVWTLLTHTLLATTTTGTAPTATSIIWGMARTTAIATRVSTTTSSAALEASIATHGGTLWNKTTTGVSSGSQSTCGVTGGCHIYQFILFTIDMVNEEVKIHKWSCLVITMGILTKMRKEAFPKVVAQHSVQPGVLGVISTISLTQLCTET